MAKNRVQVQGVSAPKLGNSIGGMGQTFVTPDQSNRGSQIAKALQNVGGITQTIASNKIQEQKEEVRLVDGIKAKNAYGVLAPSLVEHMNNQDYSITEREDGVRRRATADEMFASWANTEEYQGQLSQFGSESAKRAFEGSMAQAVAETYGKASVEFDQREMRETFSQELQVSLANGDINAWPNLDSRYVDTGLMSRPESMQQIREEAAHHFRKTGDASGFEYMEKQGMGNSAWKDETEDLKDSITADMLRKEEATDKKAKNERIKAQYSFESEVAGLLDGDPDTDLDEVISKAIENGVPNAKRLANGYKKDYTKDSEVTVSPQKDATLRAQFFELKTVKQRDQFLLRNAGSIPKDLRSHLRSNVATFNGYDKDVAFKQQLKLMGDLVEEFGDEDQYHSIVNQFSIDYAQWFESDDYTNVPVSQRVAKAQELLQNAAAGLGVAFDDQAFVKLNVGGTTQAIIDEAQGVDEIQAAIDAINAKQVNN